MELVKILLAKFSKINKLSIWSTHAVQVNAAGIINVAYLINTL